MGSNKRKGFQVGPSNLPDGTYRRKVQKIKSTLIRKAQLKKDFARVKAKMESDTVPSQRDSSSISNHLAASITPHPDRQALMDSPQRDPVQSRNESPERLQTLRNRRHRAHKADPFGREAQAAQRRREEHERRQFEFKQATEERRLKAAKRVKMQRAVAKARKPGRDGQRRLGRESVVLLEKVKKLVAEN